MDQWVRDLKGKVIIEGAGHWVKAEKPGPVNEALLGFLKSVTTQRTMHPAGGGKLSPVP
jgi:hypothetical protein